MPGRGRRAATATDEAFYVLAGTLEAQLNGDRVQAAAGSFVWVPRGTAHAFANAGPQPLHVLSIVVPGGIEALFAEQAAHFASSQGPPDPAVLDEIGERHGARTLGPPIQAQDAPDELEASNYGIPPRSRNERLR